MIGGTTNPHRAAAARRGPRVGPRSALVACLLSLAVGPALGQQELLPSADDDLFFGWSVSISGDRLAVGRYHLDSGSEHAAVYVFETDATATWVQVAQLVAPGPPRKGQVGRVVSISGDALVAGALTDDERGVDAGAAHVFARDVDGLWRHVAKLTASDGDRDDKFGVSVGLDGGRAVVGAFAAANSVGDWRGAAYVFERDLGGQWNELAKLSPVDLGRSDLFGGVVAIDGERIVVGAPYQDRPTADGSGAVYVFDRDAGGSWLLSAKLTPPDFEDSGLFGEAVAVSGDTIVVGDLVFNDQWGLATIFERDPDGSWSEVARFSGPDATLPGLYGAAVAVSGGRALVGNLNAGYPWVSVLERSGPGDWREVRRLDTGSDERVGNSVSVSGDRVLMGGYNRRGGAGAAYVFDGEFDCGNGRDDDGDTLTDCADDDCARARICIDPDGDGVENEFDCLPLDGGSHSTPAFTRAGALRVSKRSVADVEEIELRWEDLAEQAGAGTRYDVLSGELETVWTGGVLAGETCLAEDLAGLLLLEGSGPGSRYFLVRGQNDCDAGTGDWGHDVSPAAPCG